MKITYVHQYFNTPEMSGGTRSFELARRLVDMGHEVNLLTSYRDESEHTDWFVTIEAGIKVHWLPVPYSNNMNYAARMKAFATFAWRCSRKAASIDADIVFGTSTPLTIAIPSVYGARKQKVPMVFEVRDLWPELPIAMGALKNPLLRFAALKLERWAYKNSDAVVALSPGMKAGVVAAGVPSARVAIIPNGSDNREFAFNAVAAAQFRAARPWLSDRPLLTYAGTFGKINQVGYAVDLAKELEVLGSDICILLVGGGGDAEAIKAKAEETGVLGRNLFIESSIPKNQIHALLSASTMASSLFMDLPAMRANSANKFFDCLAAGKPVFLNYGGWMRDLVNDRECGFVGWNLPIREVAKTLDQKMHDKDWLLSAGRAARNLAEERFDRDTLALHLEGVLVSAAKGDVAVGHIGDYS